MGDGQCAWGTGRSTVTNGSGPAGSVSFSLTGNRPKKVVWELQARLEIFLAKTQVAIARPPSFHSPGSWQLAVPVLLTTSSKVSWVCTSSSSSLLFWGSRVGSASGMRSR